MGHLKNMFFSQQENVNTENYHDAKKIDNARKIHKHGEFCCMQKNVTNPPLIFESVHFHDILSEFCLNGVLMDRCQLL